MVYQHFTLVPSLTAAENLVISRKDGPAAINWREERKALAAFMTSMPFQVPLDQPVMRLAAGEKQKLEILKQLYLGRRFLILDEPTSVLTPVEADEVLGLVRSLCEARELTVLMITHKFREVTAFADDVSILRRGVYVGGGTVAGLTTDDMAELMVGAGLPQRPSLQTNKAGDVVLSIDSVKAMDRSGLKAIEIDRLAVRAGEIVGIAGISGNGQVELMEILTGQRERSDGRIEVKGEPYRATRAEAHRLCVRTLPEEPLQNACAPRMSVAENINFRTFDINEKGAVFLLKGRKMRQHAATLVDAFKIKTASLDSPIASLSGGNVQRAVLARELTGKVELLIISNPCFGLDFSAVAEIRSRIVTARNSGTAVLLMSEDLDEILELSDRIIVMSEGRLVFETSGTKADVAEIGRHMAGHA